LGFVRYVLSIAAFLTELSQEGKDKLIMRSHRLTGIFLFAALLTSPIRSFGGDPLCDLSPVEFPGTSFTNAIKLFGGGSSPINDKFVPLRYVFSFGPPHPDEREGYKRPVVDMFLNAVYDAQGTYEQYYQDVKKSVPDVGCDIQKVHSISWSLDHDAFLGHFHVRYLKQWCVYGATHPIAIYETDYYNKVAVSVSQDGKRIDPISTNWSTDNVSGFAKVIAQGLGALAQIITVGIVQQADVQMIDGHQKEQEALDFINTYEKTLITPVSSAGPQNPNGSTFTLDFLYTDAKFSREGNPLHPTFVVNAKQNTTYPHAANESEACQIKKLLKVIQTEGQNIPADGTEHTVVTGDSLWKLASHFYGDGGFHLLVAATNDIPDNQMNTLRVGQKVKIEPIGTFRTNNQILLVAKGDSMWQIAQQRTGGVSAFPRFQKTNSRLISDPNRIYPIEILHSPSSGKGNDQH
jgi:LysM repeat protein